MKTGNGIPKTRETILDVVPSFTFQCIMMRSFVCTAIALSRSVNYYQDGQAYQDILTSLSMSRSSSSLMFMEEEDGLLVAKTANKGSRGRRDAVKIALPFFSLHVLSMTALRRDHAFSSTRSV